MQDVVISELVIVFIVGVLVGRAVGYWQHSRDTRRWHAMLRRLMVPFDERFASPLDESVWFAGSSHKSGLQE